MKVEEMGNEALVGPAFRGDQACVDELTRRGNTVVSETEVSRKMFGRDLIGYSMIRDTDRVLVVNGKVKEVNGQPFP